ncbi:D-2-hydroxyacid dehydrogenase [Halocatena marina]|uniref:D-2-hydroxyacid dehydrogenase n=1 Tax=Halocatena marina TaxID=2934937 RepID=UPI00200D4DD6|nr:D-2-hydroxyacid dehydrogenase [Halocatena marina]
MPTAVIYHDTPIASTVHDSANDLTVVAAESESAVRNHLDDADILITNPSGWSDGFVEYLSIGNWVQATSIGYDKFPVDELTDRGVAFTNAATLHDSVMSEHTFALMFALSRKLGVTFDQQRQREWDRTVGADTWHWEGKQMTVFGLGNIGESVARRAQAFGFEVFGVKQTPSIYSGTLTSDHVVSTECISDLLPDTDILILTVPLTDETHHAIDAEVFTALPDSAVVINVARGSVVDQDALVTALADGKISGAGLDVFEDEPLAPDSKLWDREDTVVTPHIGGRSQDFPTRFARLFFDNYDRWLSKKPLANRID